MGGGEAPSAPTVALVGVGDELLFGETLDTNGSWLARELSALGFRVRGRWVVGDDPLEIQVGIREAMSSAPVVVITGGLGPTHDDRTRRVAAELFGRELRCDAGILAAIEERFRSRGIVPMPENAREMARVPAGATTLPNARGAAPGLVLDGDDGSCIFLPGVPREMRQIFRDGVAPLLTARFADALAPAVHRVIHTTGFPESLLSNALDRHLPAEMGPVTLAYLPDVRGVRLRLSARDEPGGLPAKEWLDRVETALEPVVAPFRYSSAEGDLCQAVGEALLTARKRLAAAESCTGGLIAKRMTDRPGASGYFVGGVVAYANEVKEGLLGIPPGLVAEEGAVSVPVAEAMAGGVAAATGAEAGIGVTGVAGPGGGTEEKPVGTVCYAAALDGKVVSRREHFTGDRDMVRERSAQAALFLLLRLLDGREG